MLCGSPYILFIHNRFLVISFNKIFYPNYYFLIHDKDGLYLPICNKEYFNNEKYKVER